MSQISLTGIAEAFRHELRPTRDEIMDYINDLARALHGLGVGDVVDVCSREKPDVTTIDILDRQDRFDACLRVFVKERAASQEDNKAFMLSGQSPDWEPVNMNSFGESYGPLFCVRVSRHKGGIEKPTISTFVCQQARLLTFLRTEQESGDEKAGVKWKILSSMPSPLSLLNWNGDRERVVHDLVTFLMDNASGPVRDRLLPPGPHEKPGFAGLVAGTKPA